jgi:hypothetical protein
VPYVLLTAEERKGYLFFSRGSYVAPNFQLKKPTGYPTTENPQP